MKKILINGTKWQCTKRTYEYEVGKVYLCNETGRLDGYFIYNEMWFKEHFKLA